MSFLYSERYGSASDRPAVLFLHGLGSSSGDWQLQTPVFAARRRVITVDLRGHGRSPAPTGLSTVEDMAGDVAALLAAWDEPPVHVVGLSLGGCVALALGLHNRARVRSLTLVNTFGRLRPAGMRGAWRMLARLGLLAVAPMPTVAAYVAGSLFPRPDQHQLYDEAVERLGRNTRRNYLAGLQAAARFNVLHKLDRLDCPTLILAGDRDLTVPRSAAAALQRAIPGARLRLIADCGHAMAYEQPELFNAVVGEFLEAGN